MAHRNGVGQLSLADGLAAGYSFFRPATSPLFQRGELLDATWLGDRLMASTYRNRTIVLTDPRLDSRANNSVVRLLGQNPFHSLKSVNDHQLVAAGMMQNLCMFDTRLVRSPQNMQDFSQPLITYPCYANKYHVNLPVTLNHQFNIIAASLPDETVQLFDLWTGREIKPRLNTASPFRNATALMFNNSTDNGGSTSTLLIGRDSHVEKWIWGAGNERDRQDDLVEP